MVWKNQQTNCYDLEKSTKYLLWFVPDLISEYQQYNCYDLFCFISDLISEYQQYQEATVDDYDSDDADKSQEDD